MGINLSEKYDDLFPYALVEIWSLLIRYYLFSRI
jgi:hypothetical protein